MAVPVLVFSETNLVGATITDSISSLVFASIDANSNTASLATANPVAANSNSYEKWIRMKVTTVSTNSLSGFSVYYTTGNITDGAGANGNINCFFKVNAAYATPSASTSASTVNCNTVTSAPGTTFTGPANTLNAYSNYITMQCTVATAASGGNAVFPSNYMNVQFVYA